MKKFYDFTTQDQLFRIETLVDSINTKLDIQEKQIAELMQIVSDLEKAVVAVWGSK